MKSTHGGCFNRHVVSWRNIPPNQFGGKLCPYWYDVNIKNSAKAPPLVDLFLENILGVLLLLRSYWNSLCHSKLQYSLAVLILIFFLKLYMQLTFYSSHCRDLYALSPLILKCGSFLVRNLGAMH